MAQNHGDVIRISRRRALAGAGAAAVALTVVGLDSVAAFAAPDATANRGSRPVGYLYVNGNAAGANLVAGFARAGDGSISPLPGSPIPVGGAGTGSALGSQGAIQLSATGRFLLAVDGGSNGISVSRIKRDGSLQPVAGSPFPSGGVTPVSIAVHDDRIFVANAGSGGSNYTGFILRPDGQLDPLAGSTFVVPDGAGIGDVLLDSSGRHLIGIRVTTSLIDSLTVGPGGVLRPATGSPFPAQAPGPFGSVFARGRRRRLFVSNAHGGSLKGSVSAFAIANDGALTPIAGSPYPNQQTAPCWVALAPDGRYLFTANAGSDSISSYRVNPDGSLTLVTSTGLRGGPGLGTFDLRLDPSGRFLYQVDGNKAEISVLAVSGGSLSELPASPFSLGLPAGAAPSGIAIV
ncbi:MAG: lactonase family protein [Chloroflexota bacterium]